MITNVTGRQDNYSYTALCTKVLRAVKTKVVREIISSNSNSSLLFMIANNSVNRNMSNIIQLHHTIRQTKLAIQIENKY